MYNCLDAEQDFEIYYANSADYRDFIIELLPCNASDCYSGLELEEKL